MITKITDNRREGPDAPVSRTGAFHPAGAGSAAGSPENMPFAEMPGYENRNDLFCQMLEQDNGL